MSTEGDPLFSMLDTEALRSLTTDVDRALSYAPDTISMAADPVNAGLVLFGVFVGLARGHFLIAVAAIVTCMGLAEHLDLASAPVYFDQFVAMGLLAGALHLMLVAFLGPEGGGSSFASLLASLVVLTFLLPARSVRATVRIAKAALLKGVGK